MRKKKEALVTVSIAEGLRKELQKQCKQMTKARGYRVSYNVVIATLLEEHKALQAKEASA